MFKYLENMEQQSGIHTRDIKSLSAQKQVKADFLFKGIKNRSILKEYSYLSPIT